MGSAFETISYVSRPTGAVEGTEGVGALGKQGARPILAFVQIRLFAKFSTPAIVTVTLRKK